MGQRNLPRQRVLHDIEEAQGRRNYSLSSNHPSGILQERDGAGWRQTCHQSPDVLPSDMDEQDEIILRYPTVPLSLRCRRVVDVGIWNEYSCDGVLATTISI